MATHLYDDLPTGAAKAVARAIWTKMYFVPPLILDGIVVYTPKIWTDAEIEDKIREDAQNIGFVWFDDGSNAF